MKRNVIKIKEQIRDLQNTLSKIQSKCPHKNCEREYGYSGDTATGDKCYYTRLICKDCDFCWTVEGSV